jgi:hypothetical protein
VHMQVLEPGAGTHHKNDHTYTYCCAYKIFYSTLETMAIFLTALVLLHIESYGYLFFICLLIRGKEKERRE